MFIDVPFLRTLTARLIERLRELDPDADAILALWQENDKFSDRAIAKALGRPPADLCGSDEALSN